MTTLTHRLVLLVGLSFFAGVVSARTDIPWDGFYFGGNVGDASSSTCNTAMLNSAVIGPAIASALNFGNCSNSGALVGGVQIGENFQSKRLVWGIGADLDFWSAKTRNQSLKNAGAVPPPGSYVFSSKESPSGFAVIGPRIGYAGDTWMPYVKAGTILAIGSHSSRLSYAPTATTPTASFSGGKDFATIGWAAGGGFELALNGAWSITAEYLHANLGKGSNSSSTCGGIAAACAAFSGMSFDNAHAGFSANIFRVGITYWFDYW
jgi:outer membrane immunogenic protein